jgi:hypothetical protein
MTHPLADCCPSCLTEEASPPVDPYTVQTVDACNVRALYRCPGCGHSWFTGWNADALLGQQGQGGAA